MNLLLDTHIILWSAAEPERLPAKVAKELDDQAPLHRVRKYAATGDEDDGDDIWRALTMPVLLFRNPAVAEDSPICWAYTTGSNASVSTVKCSVLLK